MFPAVLSLFLLSVTLMLTSMLPSFGSAYHECLASAMARNFIAYSDAALRHHSANPDTESIGNASLELPAGYRYLAPWRIERIGDAFYAFGTPSHEVSLSELVRLSGGRAGIKRDGRLQPYGTELPHGIPDGSVAAVLDDSSA